MPNGRTCSGPIPVLGPAVRWSSALSAPLIVRIYGTSVVGPIVLALGWLFVVSGVNTQFRAELSRSLRFKALAVTDIAAQAGSIAVAISLAAASAGYWAVVGQQITLVVLTCASNVILCKRRPGLPRRSVSIPQVFPVRRQRAGHERDRLRDQQSRQRRHRHLLGIGSAGSLQPGLPAADGSRSSRSASR